MIRAGLPHEIRRSEGAWLFADLGFARKARSCAAAFEDETPEMATFSDLVERIIAESRRSGPPLCLLLEAPLSVAFGPSGNPTGRRPEQRNSLHRYWYNGLGTAVLTSAMYVMRALTDCSQAREVLLFEGFVSFKRRDRKLTGVCDVERLRELVNNPSAFPGAILGPDDLAISPDDDLRSAFAVAGMDYGIPAMVHVDV